MSGLDQSPIVDALLQEINAAVDTADAHGICTRVKAALENTLSQHQDFLPEEFTRAVPNGYARHLLHRDPQKRYSIVMMVWDKGQGTPIHDHNGHWCVECVYKGQIEVVSYDLSEECQNNCVRFEEQERIVANIGGAGALIPPHEYHTIANPCEEKAVTMHVYKGEIESCHIFEPTGEANLFRRVRKELCYS